jgi:hypothetical protein
MANLFQIYQPLENGRYMNKNGGNRFLSVETAQYLWYFVVGILMQS